MSLIRERLVNFLLIVHMISRLIWRKDPPHPLELFICYPWWSLKLLESFLMKILLPDSSVPLPLSMEHPFSLSRKRMVPYAFA
jgi:hypothetical protein